MVLLFIFKFLSFSERIFWGISPKGLSGKYFGVVSEMRYNKLNLEIILRKRKQQQKKHLERRVIRKSIKRNKTLSVVNKEIPGQYRKIEKTSTILKNAQKIVYRKDHLKITLQITIMKNCDSYSFVSPKSVHQVSNFFYYVKIEINKI